MTNTPKKKTPFSKYKDDPEYQKHYKEIKDELFATKLLWKRLDKWKDEWRAENPNRELRLPDALKLIEWKISKTREEVVDWAKSEKKPIPNWGKGKISLTGRSFWEGFNEALDILIQKLKERS